MKKGIKRGAPQKTKFNHSPLGVFQWPRPPNLISLPSVGFLGENESLKMEPIFKLPGKKKFLRKKIITQFGI